MLLEWLHKFLSRRLAKKRHDVIRLRWQQAQLQETLKKMKDAPQAEDTDA